VTNRHATVRFHFVKKKKKGRPMPVELKSKKKELMEERRC
jgi:acyl-CoA hydrolase